MNIRLQCKSTSTKIESSSEVPQKIIDADTQKESNCNALLKRILQLQSSKKSGASLSEKHLEWKHLIFVVVELLVLYSKV